MKLKDIVKKVGSSIIRNVVPGGGILVDAVNAFLPEDKKLPTDATGSQVEEAVDSLPPEQRAAVFEKKFDVQLEQIKQQGETLQAMLIAEQKSTHTTRPYIAKGAFQVVAVCTLAVIFTWCGGVWLNRPDIVEKAQDAQTFMLYVLGPLVALLMAYFGILKQEHNNRLNASQGSPIPSLLGAVAKRIIK
jgi:hypothetical protein